MFAITRAVEFCFTNFEGIEGNGTNCVFDHDKVRSHLLTCENLGSLPKRLDTRPVCFEFHNVTVSRFCECGLPDTLENVIMLLALSGSIPLSRKVSGVREMVHGIVRNVKCKHILSGHPCQNLRVSNLLSK